ncbi:hypothetical protein J6590_058133 [Homalodisca vitripennis]|nr:hypothetical protein J6590_058133 [Homalodisca vitripennis]
MEAVGDSESEVERRKRTRSENKNPPPEMSERDRGYRGHIPQGKRLERIRLKYLHAGFTF